MLTLIEGGEVYDPEPRGIQSILVVRGEISRLGAIDRGTVEALGIECEVTDARGCVVTPGFIDPHEHIIGGAGEEGFATRTGEVSIEDLTSAGITTVVGLLGTDVETRHLTSLLAKARQLTAAGMSAYIYTGGFPVPTPTITGSIMGDLVNIDLVIGVGEIAIADYRSSEPTVQDLAKLVSQAITGGLVGGKAGVTHFHVGEGRGRLAILRELLDGYDIPPQYVYATHVNRTPELLAEAIDLAHRGAFVDMDTVDPGLEDSLAAYLQGGGNPAQLTVSSDAQTANATPEKLYRSFVASVRDRRLPLESVLPVFTCNTARALKLKHKGGLREGMDGDLLVLGKDSLELRSVIAHGKPLMKDGQVLA